MAASLFLMIFGFVLLAHWLACIWYSIGMSDLENFIHYGWIPRLSSDIGLTSKNYSLFDAKVWSQEMPFVTPYLVAHKFNRKFPHQFVQRSWRLTIEMRD